jgi:hypothetical protein
MDGFMNSDLVPSSKREEAFRPNVLYGVVGEGSIADIRGEIRRVEGSMTARRTRVGGPCKMQLSLLNRHELGRRSFACPDLTEDSQVVTALDFLRLDAKESHLGEKQPKDEI